MDYQLTEQIIGLAMKVHRVLGPGFLESVYRNALLVEFQRAGVEATAEKRIQVRYEGVIVGDFVADILVEGQVLVELKAVAAINKSHQVQTVNYLTATGTDVGLLMNFGSESLQFKRKFREKSSAK